MTPNTPVHGDAFPRFRFEELEVWKKSATLSLSLFRLADSLEQRHLHRFAEQLRGATLSVSNNIAEGSGSESTAEFANFLNMARRSVFEIANILILLNRGSVMQVPGLEDLLTQLDHLSRMLTLFRRTLKSRTGGA